ncbi:carboxypeptidase regulatory-like domain-containing protein [Rhodopirellula europaea]|uniref:carboxypeptidase regulatory-like domain-containing protein n=1 Tax=Rhodopirellula europaea TaxID=1263866 RepID=UPI003D2A6276
MLYQSKSCWVGSLAVTCFQAMSLLAVSHSHAEENPGPATATLKVSVQGEFGGPIPDASVEAFQWTGEMSPLGNTAQTDAKGEAELAGLPLDDYLYVQISAEGYVRKTPAITFTTATTQDLTVTMYRPVEGWIEVRGEDGQPVVGAELMVLNYTDQDGTEFVLYKGIADSAGAPWQVSDAAGKLELPPMPANVSLSLMVIHPDWKPTKVAELEPVDGLVSSVTLHKGVPVEVVLQPVRTGQTIPDGTTADVLMMASAGGSFGGLTIRHPFEINDNRIRFQAESTNFGEIRVAMDDYFVGPVRYNFPDSPFEPLNLTNADSSTIDLNAYPKQKVRGRVVDHLGNGIKNVHVRGVLIDAERMKAIAEASIEGDGSPAPFRKAAAMTIAGGATTDVNGDYEIELAPGPVSIEAMHHGFYTKDEMPDFEVTQDADRTLPDVILLPVPTIRGIVQDQTGKPVPGVIAKLTSLGRGDTLPVALSDEDGRFELTMTRIPYAAEGEGLESDASVLAIDPRGKLSGSTDVDLLKHDSAADVIVTLSTDQPKWLSEIKKSSDQPRSEESLEQIETLKAKYAAGVVGQPAPRLTSGTWLNTTATSLEAFRGRFVLLDFWFIGCGPCHRDMPEIKVAHEAFPSDKFAVVSVHTNSMKPEVVQAFADENKMLYAIVVDDARGQIEKDYRALGVDHYPSYLLIAPDGNILLNDAVPDGVPTSLRQHKLELIHHAIQSWDRYANDRP